MFCTVSKMSKLLFKYLKKKNFTKIKNYALTTKILKNVRAVFTLTCWGFELVTLNLHCSNEPTPASTGCLEQVSRCLQVQVPPRGGPALFGSWTAAARVLGQVALQEEALASQVAQSGVLQMVASRLSVPAFKVHPSTHEQKKKKKFAGSGI